MSGKDPGSRKPSPASKAMRSSRAASPAKAANPERARKAAGGATPAPRNARDGSVAGELAAPAQGALHNRARRGVKRGAALKEHATEVYARLAREYPDAHCELDHRNPLELLCATILSAQCTDKRVNMVTPTLFARYPDARSLSQADPAELEEIIKSTGFFRNKTKSLLGMSSAVVEKHGGEVPDTMDALVKLPGVGRKTANVVLGNAFGRNEGVVVDTHVARLSARLGFTKETDPVKIEEALMPLFPREQWTMLSHLLIFHGRRICDARVPKCGACVLNDICPSARVPQLGSGGTTGATKRETAGVTTRGARGARQRDASSTKKRAPSGVKKRDPSGAKNPGREPRRRG